MKDSDLEAIGFNLATHNKVTGKKTRFIDNTRLIAGVESLRYFIKESTTKYYNLSEQIKAVKKAKIFLGE